MELNEYQKLATSTAIYNKNPLVQNNPLLGELYCALQLSAEAGEVASKYAKALRKGQTDIDHEALMLELGDILWYIANLASDLNITLEDIAIANYTKLKDRKERNVLHGEGDYR